jgi:hypothetical protein
LFIRSGGADIRPTTVIPKQIIANDVTESLTAVSDSVTSLAMICLHGYCYLPTQDLQLQINVMAAQL